MFDDTKDDKQNSKMGRPQYQRTPYDEGKLEGFLEINLPHTLIALYLMVNIKTLKKHYPELFESAPKKVDKTDLVENALFFNAVYKHNVVAQIAWLKAHRHESYGDRVNRTDTELSVPDLFAELSKTLPH